jgi:ribulose-phosphate 3-epimerase
MSRTVLEHLLDGGPHLSAGLLTADLLHLADELNGLPPAGIDIVHIDVADGAFCPLFTVGAPFVKALPSTFFKDAHLMVNDPLSKVEAIVAAGADLITFHVEGAAQPHRVLQALSAATNANDPERGIVRGIALNPSTPVAIIEPLLELADLVLLLAINPGWSSQHFLATTDRRADQARRLIEAAGRPIALGLDGGITRDNVAHAASLGVDLIVTGSAIYDGGDATANALAMQQLVRGAPKSRVAVPA